MMKMATNLPHATPTHPSRMEIHYGMAKNNQGMSGRSPAPVLQVLSAFVVPTRRKPRDGWGASVVVVPTWVSPDR
jgi:hypothetical protein